MWLLWILIGIIIGAVAVIAVLRSNCQKIVGDIFDVFKVFVNKF